MKGQDEMSKWEMVPIPEVVFFQEGPGVRSSQYTSTGVKLLNVANLQDGKVDLSTSNRYVSEEEAYGKYSHFLVDEGDFIIASSGIQVDYFDKKMGFINASHLPLCMNTSTIRFKSLDAKKLGIRYFMHYLKTQQFKNQLRRLITGSAQLNFGPSHLRRMRIPLPPLDIQHQITQALDQVDALVASREQQIVLLNELVKSRFVEMFGFPDYEQKHSTSTKVRTIDELCILLNGYAFKSEDYVDEGIRVVRISNVQNGYIEDKAPKFYPFEALPLIEKFLLQENDLLVSLTGNVGRVGVLGREMLPAALNQRVACLRIKNNSILDLTYLFNYLNQDSFELSCNKASKGVAQKNLSTEWLKKISVFVPDMCAQKQFSSFVDQVDKSKFAIQKSLTELETLKKALMQQYFS